ncbi:hypothetical protein PUNSTDRAFT_52406 [Punctularia strigosozonata HHB-11173 SS5]|uniref:uncharacterized protein n=1 Tax=Punctularia strigosozonata (strain HHB-11173) TaxID=741275 RepID=UPI0004418249|nr:uncharacterized protein PUNSTDRAFT_52406 [Punctularia strigosozonata HHB-11173 SS5]EIN08989.1 hypothetical protein PUNSTDRAFT_52406 [Punctularia strigosozonata HHB-11173 SS5]
MTVACDTEAIYTETYLQFAVKHRRALTRISPWMSGKALRPNDCPLFHYGVGIPLEQLRAYGIRRGLIPRDEAHISLSVLSRLDQIVKDIAKRCNGKLYRAKVAHYSYTNVVALYTNYSKHLRHRSSEEDERVISFIKAELEIPSDCRALWYWDTHTPKTVTEETLSIPKAVESRMQRLKLENGEQTMEFESVDEEIIQRYASFGTKPKTGRA